MPHTGTSPHWPCVSPSLADSSAIKVYGSELNIEASRALLEVLGAPGLVAPDNPGAVLRGRIESSYRNGLILTFGGGTNEIQYNVIAKRVLGLPE